MPGQLIVAALLLALASPAWAGTYCTTYAEKILGRLQTLYDDGTRAVSTWNRTMARWETTVTPPLSYRGDKRYGPSRRPRAGDHPSPRSLPSS